MNPALQGYLAAVEESLADPGPLSEAGVQLRELAEVVEASPALLSTVNDGSIPVAARRSVLASLLEGKVMADVARLVHQAVTVVPAGEVVSAFRWLGGRLERRGAGEQSAEEILGRMGSRHRVEGYAAAVFEGLSASDLEEVEDQLFRFARTVESDRALRLALGDRDLPVDVRQQVVSQLLGGKVLVATERLVRYAVRGGRARDIVITLDALVESAARARGWRVARVQTADAIDGTQGSALCDALSQLTGHPVDLQVTVDPALLGGVVVQVGDLLVDSSTRHRLDELKERLLASEETYRVPGSTTGSTTEREPADG